MSLAASLGHIGCSKSLHFSSSISYPAALSVASYASLIPATLALTAEQVLGGAPDDLRM